MVSTVRVPPVGACAAAAAVQMMSGSQRPSGVRRFAALLVGALSGAMLASSLREFRHGHTTVNPMAPERATSLITGGPHAISRNPMYVGMVGALAAHALWRGRTRAILPALAFVAYLDRAQIPAEEHALQVRFGPEYAVYARRVRRWL